MRIRSTLVSSHYSPHLSLPLVVGAASIVDELDKRVMIILRDGRHLIGILRSFDQFMNLIIEETYERIIVGGIFSYHHYFNLSQTCLLTCISLLKSSHQIVEKYSDILMGLYIVRGDNIVVMGEIDTVKEV